MLLWLQIPLVLANDTESDVFSHEMWNDLLSEHVTPIRSGVATEVNYAGFYKDRELLGRYLKKLAQVERVEFDVWDADIRLAFLINAYNAWTVEYILTAWPGIGSIKELGSLFRSPWRVDFIPLLGEELSLDEIEHGMIREKGDYNEPLIHFAVNCASIGCPALRSEAFVPERLKVQLKEQATLFLQDRTRNYAKGKTLYLSPIFKWYRDDFEMGWQGIERIEDFLLAYAPALHLDDEQRALLKGSDMKIKYTKYNWDLNIKR